MVFIIVRYENEEEAIPMAVSPFCWDDFFGVFNFSSLNDALQLLYPHTKGAICSSLYNKGRHALLPLLKLLSNRNPVRTDIILPAYGAESLFYAVISAKLRIKLCDISIEDMLYDSQQLGKMLEKHHDRCLAIIMPYNYGIIPYDRMKELRVTISYYQIPIIDDFAQSLPLSQKLVNYFSKNVQYSLFSFTGGKVITSLKGGLIVSHPPSPVILERNMGISKRTKLISLRTWRLWQDYKMRINRKTFARDGIFDLFKDMYPTNVNVEPQMLSRSWERILCSNFKKYHYLIKNGRADNDSKWRNVMNDVAPHCLFNAHNEQATGARFPIFLPSQKLRDELQQQLLAEKFWTGRGFVHAIPNVDCIKPYLSENDRKIDNFPAAYDLEQRLLTLPNHFILKNKDITYFAGKLSKLLQ